MTAIVPSLSQTTLQRPSVEHAFTQAARVPFLDAPSPQVTRDLEARGFQKVAGQDAFVADDASWLQYSPQDRRWERGVGQIKFRGMPAQVDALPTVPYHPGSHGYSALAQLPRLDPKDADGIVATLERAGFSRLFPNYFRHDDGSWVAFVGESIKTGIGSQLVTGSPADGGAPSTPRRANGSYPTYSSLPFPGDWSSWRANFAVAKLPRADGRYGIYNQQQLERILTQLGFQKDSGSGATGEWSHPDGSKASTWDGRIVGTRFQQWGFGDFPYNIRVHWPQWQRDTEAWTSWVNGRNPPPF